MANARDVCGHTMGDAQNGTDMRRNQDSLKGENTTSRGGIGFVGLLTITFIVLKLTGVISWSWVWVLSPIWISVLLVTVLLLVLAVVVAVQKRLNK